MHIEKFKVIPDETVWKSFVQSVETALQLQIEKGPSEYPCLVAVYPDNAKGVAVCCFLYQQTARDFLSLTDTKPAVPLTSDTDSIHRTLLANVLAIVQTLREAKVLSEPRYETLFNRFLAELEGMPVEQALSDSNAHGSSVLKRSAE